MAAVHVADPYGVVGHVTYLLLCFGIAGATWWGALRSNGAHRRFAAFAAIGLTCASVGMLILRITTWITGSRPGASLADIVWLGAYVFMAVALLELLRGDHREHRRDKEGLIDVGVILVCGLLVV